MAAPGGPLRLASPPLAGPGSLLGRRRCGARPGLAVEQRGGPCPHEGTTGRRLESRGRHLHEVVRLVQSLGQADAVDRFELRLRRLSGEQIEWLRAMLDALARDADS